MSHVLIAQTVVLVAVSLAILYPVVAYARTLLYTEAVTMLAASLLVFTAGSIVEEGIGLIAASEGLYLLSALCFAGAVWLFAREFVRIDSGGFDVEAASAGASTGFADTDGAEGGFGRTTEGEDGE